MSAPSARVLVAEDQPLLRWALGRVLGSLGADVVSASTYHQACDLLAAGEFAAAVVASPLDGHTVMGLLRELDRSRPEIRLVALCDGEACSALQDDIPHATVFQKPFTLGALVAVVASAIGIDDPVDTSPRRRHGATPRPRTAVLR